MDVATFFIATVITLGVLLLLRLFWQEILIIAYVLYVIGMILFISLISTLLWIIFVSANSQGWGWLFLYFNIAYTGILVVYGLIISDIFYLAVHAVKRLFK
jgi:hypothetical protein